MHFVINYLPQEKSLTDIELEDLIKAVQKAKNDFYKSQSFLAIRVPTYLTLAVILGAAAFAIHKFHETSVEMNSDFVIGMEAALSVTAVLLAFYIAFKVGDLLKTSSSSFSSDEEAYVLAQLQSNSKNFSSSLTLSGTPHL